mmetsp:Transcript_13972/g.33173  ORF Transcript_13972/g.33173 Transcript_13972/m.33173 type:complete len:179 (-) Transcript_13972:37-573(-)
MGKSTASSSLLENSRKKNYRDHYVNGTPFTIAMATFAVVAIGGAICGASMFVAGTAKEAQELLPAAPADLVKDKTYGATHAGVGFANYVVGNAVSSFWQKEMGKTPGAKSKMTDPFASFLLKPKKGKKGPTAPEQEADDAQPVDTEHHRIIRSRATGAAIKHAQDVAASHVKKARAQV